jgi:hypothetical protein
MFPCLFSFYWLLWLISSSVIIAYHSPFHFHLQTAGSESDSCCSLV